MARAGLKWLNGQADRNLRDRKILGTLENKSEIEAPLSSVRLSHYSGMQSSGRRERTASLAQQIVRN